MDECLKLFAFVGEETSLSSFLRRWWTFDSRQCCYQTGAASKSLKRFLIALITVPSSRRNETPRCRVIYELPSETFMSWWSESVEGSLNPGRSRIWSLSSLWRESTRSHSVRVPHAVFQAHIKSLLFHAQIKVSQTSTFPSEFTVDFACLRKCAQELEVEKNGSPKSLKHTTEHSHIEVCSINIFQGCLHPPVAPNKGGKIFTAGGMGGKKLKRKLNSCQCKKLFLPLRTEFQCNEDSCKTSTHGSCPPSCPIRWLYTEFRRPAPSYRGAASTRAINDHEKRHVSPAAEKSEGK